MTIPLWWLWLGFLLWLLVYGAYTWGRVSGMRWCTRRLRGFLEVRDPGHEDDA
jgi:hypothetical protein